VSDGFDGGGGGRMAPGVKAARAADKRWTERTGAWIQLRVREDRG
jgi:hypothetical protein